MSRHSHRASTSSISSTSSTFPLILGKDSNGALVYGAWASEPKTEPKPAAASPFIAAQLPPLSATNGRPALLSKVNARSPFPPIAALTSSVASATITRALPPTTTTATATASGSQARARPVGATHYRKLSERVRYDLGSSFIPPSPTSNGTNAETFPGNIFPSLRPSVSTGSIDSISSSIVHPHSPHPLDKAQSPAKEASPPSPAQVRLRHASSASNLRKTQLSKSGSPSPPSPAHTQPVKPSPLSINPVIQRRGLDAASTPGSMAIPQNALTVNGRKTPRSAKRASGLFDYDLLAKSPSSRPPGAFFSLMGFDYNDDDDDDNEGVGKKRGANGTGTEDVISEQDVKELRRRIMKLAGEGNGAEGDESEYDEGRESSGEERSLGQQRECSSGGTNSTRSATPEFDPHSSEVFARVSPHGRLRDNPNRVSTATTLTATTNRSSLFSLAPERDRFYASGPTARRLDQRTFSVATTYTADTAYADEYGDSAHFGSFNNNDAVQDSAILSPTSPLTSLSHINLSLSILTDTDVPPSWQTQFQNLAQSCLRQSEDLEVLAREVDQTRSRVRDLITIRCEIEEQLDGPEETIKNRIKECEDLTAEMQMWMESLEGVMKEVMSGGVPIGIVTSKPFPRS